ncbi:MAG: hypothetical protein ACYTX0_52570 [Nostoc sp.]
MVQNLHGSRMKEFWEKANSLNHQPDSEKRQANAEISKKDAGSKEIGASYKFYDIVCPSLTLISSATPIY